MAASQVSETFKNLFAGSIGGMCQVLSGQPFDIIKIRMQRQSLINPEYSSVLDWVRSVYRNEGFMGFYKGTLSPITGISICVSLQFAGNSIGKTIQTKINELRGKSNPQKLTTVQFMISGGTGGFVNSFAWTPVENIRIIMQSQTNKAGTRGRYTGSYDALL